MEATEYEDVVVEPETESVDPAAEDYDDDEPEVTESKSSAEVDKLLDDYEDYMKQTIKLAKKAQGGDMSAMTEYTSLLEKAESLSNKLENFEGEMTAAQLARLQKIAAMAAQAMM